MHNEEAILEDIARLESKLKAVRRKGNLVVESQICNRLGKKYELVGEWHEALTFHHFDSEIAAAMDDYEGHLIALNNLALVYKRLELISRAKTVFRRMISFSEKVPTFARKKCLSGMLDASLGLCHLYLDLCDDQPIVVVKELQDRAWNFLKKAEESSTQFQALLNDGLLGKTEGNLTQNVELRIKTLIGKARLFGQIDRATEAISFLFQAERIAMEEYREQQDSLRAHWIFQILEVKGYILGNTQGKWSEAIESCFDRELQIAKEFLDDDRVADAQYNLAFASLKLNDYNLAKSTILTCMDTVKVRCQSQTKSARVEQLLAKTFSACELFSSIEALDHELSSGDLDVDSTLDFIYQKTKVFVKLDRKYEAYSEAMKLPALLERGGFSRLIRRRVFKIVSETAMQMRCWDDAMFFCRKWLECLTPADPEDDEVLRLECLLLLLQIHVAANVFDRNVLTYAEECEDIGGNLSSMDQLILLSCKSLIQDSLGLSDEAEQFRQECIGLFTALQTQREESKLAGSKIDIDGLSYFADRKVSRTTRSLMGGDFQMETRAGHKAGGIAKRRIRRPRVADELQPKTKKGTRPKCAVLIQDSDEGSDLGDFIASCNEVSGSESSASCNEGVEMYSDLMENLDMHCNDEIDRVSQEFASIASGTSRKRPKKFNRQRIQNLEDMNDFMMAEPENAPYQQLALRIHVAVEEEVFVIPCYDDDITERKKISWLLAEASLRYTELKAKEPIIGGICVAGDGSTEGAWLSPSDPIALVLTDGQRVKGRIDGWRKRSWIQEYRNQLGRLGTVADANVEEVLSQADADSSSLDLSFIPIANWEALAATIKAKSAQYPCNLNFSGCPSLNAHELQGVPLAALDISFTTLTNLSDLLVLLEQGLDTLRTLNLSFVQAPFEWNGAILQVLSKSKALHTLDLSGLSDLRGLENFAHLENLYLDATTLMHVP